MFRYYLMIGLAMLSIAGATLSAQRSTWTIDPNQTQVNFQVRRIPVSYVRGSFSGVTGTLQWDTKQLSNSSVKVIIPTASVSTNNAMRDSDLKSSNFFNVEKYPLMTFQSTAVTGTPGHLQVMGDLTLGEITRPVVLIVDGPTPPTRMGKWIMGFEATGTLKRSDFNFASKYPTAILGDEIKFTIDVEADQ